MVTICLQSRTFHFSYLILNVENTRLEDRDTVVAFFKQKGKLAFHIQIIKTKIHIKVCITSNINPRPISILWSLDPGLVLGIRLIRDVIQILIRIFLYLSHDFRVYYTQVGKFSVYIEQGGKGYISIHLYAYNI